jgi:hypothetical protein
VATLEQAELGGLLKGLCKKLENKKQLVIKFLREGKFKSP